MGNVEDKEKGGKVSNLDKLNEEQKRAFLHYLDFAELDIEEEIKEGITEELEAEGELRQIERIRRRLTKVSSTK